VRLVCDESPKTATGKIQKFNLMALVAKRDPGREQEGMTAR